MRLQTQFELKWHCLYSVVHWHLPSCLGLHVIHQWRLVQLYLHTDQSAHHILSNQPFFLGAKPLIFPPPWGLYSFRCPAPQH